MIAIIRKARPEDIDALVELLRILFSIEKDFNFHPPRQRRGLEMMLENDRGIVLVAEQEKQVIGMCSGQLMVSTAEGGFSLLVEDVVVHEPWQGQGVGTGLLQALAEWGRSKNAARFQLLADRTNTKGLEFYQHRAWRQTKLICLTKRPEH